MVWGVRPTLFIGFLGLVLCSGVGTLIGLVSGSLGGIVDAVLARVIDVMMSFPPIIVAIAVVGVIRPGTTSVVLALGIAFAPRFARVVRGEVLTVLTVASVVFTSGAPAVTVTLSATEPT